MISFTKYNSCGNDFILVSEPDYPITRELIHSICQNKYGVGSDGFIILNKINGNFEFRYYNNDGFEANMCLNGVRAAIMHVGKHLSTSDKITLHARNEIVHGVVIDNACVSTLVKQPELIKQNYLSDEEKYPKGFLFNVGVLHYIVPVNNLEDPNLMDDAAYLCKHSLHGEGYVNVVFVSTYDTPTNSVKVRVYEKGIYAETLSCGTAAVALFSWYRQFVKLTSRLNIKFVTKN
ncbi:diaminopimelate epimerase, partial [Chlamydiia bacterium]|nr:diaminopimelate epimerase [Chlamydiia bacterium]